jgi:hypothetical protein
MINMYQWTTPRNVLFNASIETGQWKEWNCSQSWNIIHLLSGRGKDDAGSQVILYACFLTIPFYRSTTSLAINLLQHIKKFLFSFSIFSDSEKFDLIDWVKWEILYPTEFQIIMKKLVWPSGSLQSEGWIKYKASIYFSYFCSWLFKLHNITRLMEKSVSVIILNKLSRVLFTKYGFFKRFSRLSITLKSFMIKRIYK